MDKFEREVTTTLQELRIPAHFRGYEAIKTAMNVIRDNPKIKHQVMKLYTAIGEKLDASPAKIERNIRHALESARSDYEVQERVIGTNEELTAGQFLATMYEAIWLRLEGKIQKEGVVG